MLPPAVRAEFRVAHTLATDTNDLGILQNASEKYPRLLEDLRRARRLGTHLRIEAEVKDGFITDAWSAGTMVRGLEIILKGRDPRDAWAFCERVCGVCTTVHALASVRAVENALAIEVPKNARLVRNLLRGRPEGRFDRWPERLLSVLERRCVRRVGEMIVTLPRTRSSTPALALRNSTGVTRRAARRRSIQPKNSASRIR